MRSLSLSCARRYRECTFADTPNLERVAGGRARHAAWPTAAGALLIIGSGIFTIYRERKRKDAAPVVAESTARTGARGL